MISLRVITIKLNTLTNVPYQMTVGNLFTYIHVKTRKRGQIKDLDQRSRVYNVVHYNAGFFPVDPDNCVIMESQCIYLFDEIEIPV